MALARTDIEGLDLSIRRDFEERDRFRSLGVCIGDLPSRLWVDSESLFEEAKKKYSAFLTSLPPAFEVLVTHTGLGEQTRFAAVLESTSADSRHYVFRWDFAIRLDLQERLTYARLHVDFPASVDSILRICYALYILSHDGILFHSASVRMSGRALALIGGTGCGKSELSKRLGAEVFSDELTLIREHQDGFWLYGTPFHGQFPQFKNDKAPVSCILALREKEAEQEIETKAHAIRFLMRHAFFFGDAPATSKLLLTQVMRLVEKVPIRGLLLDQSLRSLEGDKLREVILELCKP